MIMVLLVFAKFLNILFEPIFKMGNFMFTPVLSSVSSRDEDEISYWSGSASELFTYDFWLTVVICRFRCYNGRTGSYIF